MTGSGFFSGFIQNPSIVNRLLSVAGSGRSTTGIVANLSCSFRRSIEGLQSKSSVSNGFQSATQPNTRNPSEIVFVSVGCSGKSARTPMIWQTSIKAKPHAKADNEAP